MKAKAHAPTPASTSTAGKVRLHGQEVLAALPNMSRQEKKELHRALQEEEQRERKHGNKDTISCLRWAKEDTQAKGLKTLLHTAMPIQGEEAKRCWPHQKGRTNRSL